jgi:hypothetical protein
MARARSVAHPITAAVLLAANAFCGGSSSPAAISGLSVGGTYDTQVTLLPDGNTCGAVQVQNNPTIVDHVSGSASLALTHARNRYPGTVDRTGRFSTPPLLVSGSFSISIAGQFSPTVFDATVQVDQVSPACGYRVHWVGTKSGPPNTFP